MYKKHLFCFCLVLQVVLLLTTSCITFGDSSSGPVSLDRAIQMAARNIENNVMTGQKIALLNFNSPSEQFSEYVLEELTSQLVSGKKLIVVDRRELELIRQEESFQLSGEVSDESAQAIGRKLGAQLIVSGSLNAIGNAYRIRIRVLNVETAAIEASPSADISAAEEKVIFLLDGKGSIQVNTSSRQTTTPTRTASGNLNRVYVSGDYETSGDYGRAGCYWIDGVRIELPVPSDTAGSSASAIVVSDGKIYVAGDHSSRRTGRIRGLHSAAYWVDGVRTDLPVPSGAELPTATAIAVSGGKVYVTGYYLIRDSYRADYTACYWVDGVRTDLPILRGGSDASAVGIAVSGGKAYVAGSYQHFSPSLSEEYRTACYWIDGVIKLIDPDYGNYSCTDANAIVVSGDKVYVAGEERHGFRLDKSIACYWVDGTKINLPVPDGSNNTTALAIAVSDGRVYVAGSYGNKPDSGIIDETACYWVDGVKTDLAGADGNKYSTASGITVFDGKIYVSGYYWNSRDGTGGTACYWVNGVKTDLPSPNNGAKTHAIAVGR